MSSIHTDDHDGNLAKQVHRLFHEIEERTDTNADKVAEIIELWENGKPKVVVGPTWFCANCDAETTTAKCKQCGRLCGPPLPRKRVYRAHGATVMDEDGGFSVGYGVDVHRAKMIADALNVPNASREA